MPPTKPVGGVLGALGHRAEEIYVELDEAAQEAARQLFLRLVTLGEGVEDTRRRVLMSELGGRSDLRFLKRPRVAEIGGLGCLRPFSSPHL